jgi:RNA polymerase sigma-70 factor (ECF subfamily)
VSSVSGAPAAARPLAPICAVEPPRARGQASGQVSGQVSAEDFCAAHFPFVWRNIRHLVGFDSAVDDLAQEVFIIALRRMSDFQGRSSAQTWLYGILRRVVANHRRTLRRRRIRDSVDLEAVETRDSGPHRRAEKAEALRVLYQMLDQIDESRREVFVLAEIEHMTATQIADALGINDSTVEARLRDARRDLQAIAQRQRLKERVRSERRGLP